MADGRVKRSRRWLADPQWRRWNQYRAFTRTPAGDSIREVQERVLAHFRKLEQTFDAETIAIVTHAEVIRSVVLLALQAPIDEYSSIRDRARHP